MIRQGILKICSLHPETRVLLLNRYTSASAVQHGLKQVRPFEEIPGPKPSENDPTYLPGIGNVANLDFNTLSEALYKNYGTIVRLPGQGGDKDVVYLYDPHYIETVFRNEGQWPVKEIFNSMLKYRDELRRDFFKGVVGIVTQGKKWHDFRRSVNPAMMQPRATKLYVGPIDKVAKEFIQRMKDLRDKNGQLPDDFMDHMFRWALESISLIALDTRLGCLQPNNKPDSETEKFIAALQLVMKAMFLLDVPPPLPPSEKEALWNQMVDALDYFNEKEINYKEQTLFSLVSSHHIHSPLVISVRTNSSSGVGVFLFRQRQRQWQYITWMLMNRLLLESPVGMKYIKQAQDRIMKRSPDAQKDMSVLETLLIKNEDPMIPFVMALDMMLAGVDTTANLTAKAAHFLSRNLDKQEILYEELKRILPRKDQEITANNLEDMKYLKACLKETSRIAPVSAGNFRQTPADMVIGNYLIPKGINLIMDQKVVCNLEENFPEPQKFIPERWLKDGDQLQTAHPFAYLPFGFGPRMCLGRRFAELEAAALIANIFRNFRLEHDEDLKEEVQFLSAIANKLNFRLEDRS